MSADTWYDEHGKPFQPQVHYFVGGATKLYGAALYRLREEDFGELEHDDGASPAWPVGYDEFEPYYTQAERLYQVHGARGEDPTEPPASAPYPFPAVSHEPRIQQLSDDLAAAGLHPFHAPCGVMLDEPEPPNSRCIRCATCDGFPCLVHAKSDAEVLAVRPALEHDNVTLLTNTRVLRLETNAAGTAITGVVGDGEQETFTADIVVVSCGATNSAALLLASANAAHPHGLANGSGQLGRNYMFHNSQAVLALSKDENPTMFQKTLGLNDFYFGSDEFQYPLGNIQMVGKSSADMYRGEKPLQTKLAPSWTLRGRRASRDRLLAVDGGPAAARQPGHAARTTGASSSPTRRPTSGPRSGCCTSSRRCWAASGSTSTTCCPTHAYLRNDIPVAGVAHQAGTCRFGRDPETSVLNTDCRAHEVDNLYVVDTSFFPSIGAVNPALTAMANALRVGDHLLARLGVDRPARSPVSAERRRVAIVGGGFGGLAAAQALRKADVDVTLRRPHEPPPVPAAAVPARLRHAVDGRLRGPDPRDAAQASATCSVAMAEVTEVDPERRELTLDRGERLGYDSLIVACGATTSYFGHDEWAGAVVRAQDARGRGRAARPDPVVLRGGRAREDAGRARRLSTIVVIGGGPTGVEVAGQLAVLARHHLRHQFTRFDPGDDTRRPARRRRARAHRLQPEAVGQGRAASWRRSASTCARARARPRSTPAASRYEQDGTSRRIEAATVIWAAGVHAAPFARTLAEATGADARPRRPARGARPTAALPGHPEISVIGDAAAHAGPDGKPLPGLATVAIQQARHVAQGIATGAPGATAPFRYFDKGALAVVGRGRAICAVRGLELSGPLAFGTYLGVHLFYLGGVPGRRLTVLSAWASTALRAGAEPGHRARAAASPRPRVSRRERRPGTDPVRAHEHLPLPVRAGDDGALVPRRRHADVVVPLGRGGVAAVDALLRHAAVDQRRRRRRHGARRRSSSSA